MFVLGPCTPRKKLGPNELPVFDISSRSDEKFPKMPQNGSPFECSKAQNPLDSLCFCNFRLPKGVPKVDQNGAKTGSILVPKVDQKGPKPSNSLSFWGLKSIGFPSPGKTFIRNLIRIFRGQIGQS